MRVFGCSHISNNITTIVNKIVGLMFVFQKAPKNNKQNLSGCSFTVCVFNNEKKTQYQINECG